MKTLITSRRSKWALLVILSCSFCLASSQGSVKTDQGTKERLDQASKQWLEEVVPYIITDAEKRAFLMLSTDEERGAFIENFWKKRDPLPATTQNEFKLEYYRRIALANKFLGSSGLDGWRSDRGKILILLGPPQEIQRNMTPSGTLFASFQGPQEIWNYWNLPNPKLPNNLEFVFVDKYGTGNFVLDNSIKLDQEESSSLSIANLKVQFDTMEFMSEAQKNPFENMGKLKELITTQVSYDLIPIRLEFLYLKGSGKSTYIPLIIEVPMNALTPQESESQTFESLDMLVNISNNLGQIIFEKSKHYRIQVPSLSADRTKGQNIRLMTSIALDPEVYSIHLLVVDNISGRIGSIHQQFSAPDFGQEGLASSDIILSLAKSEAQGPAPEGNNLRPAEERIVAESTRVFRSGEEMDVYFEVYHLSLKKETGRNDLKVEYVLSQDGKDLMNIPSPPIKFSAQPDIRVMTSFKLMNIRPGGYLIRARIRDMNAGSTVEKEAAFIIAK